MTLIDDHGLRICDPSNTRMFLIPQLVLVVLARLVAYEVGFFVR